MVMKPKEGMEIINVTGVPVVDVNFVKPSSTGAKDAAITITVKNGSGPYKVIAVSNTSLGTITKEGGNTIVLDQLYAGFYKLYIVDSDKNTTEYQVTID
jgi:hypothetical protein